MNLWEVASELSRRLVDALPRATSTDGVRRRPPTARRPIRTSATSSRSTSTSTATTGAGLGATHQTGWTALVAKLLQQSPLWDAKWDDKLSRIVR